MQWSQQLKLLIIFTQNSLFHSTRTISCCAMNRFIAVTHPMFKSALKLHSKIQHYYLEMIIFLDHYLFSLLHVFALKLRHLCTRPLCAERRLWECLCVTGPHIWRNYTKSDNNEFRSLLYFWVLIEKWSYSVTERLTAVAKGIALTPGLTFSITPQHTRKQTVRLKL